MIHLPPLRRPVIRPKGERGRRTRRQLLDAAEVAFGSRGYFETSIVDVTRRAGVAMGTFYVYFPSKRAIFTELVRERNRDLRRTIQEATSGLDDRREVERVGFRTFFQFIRRHRNMYRIVRQAEFVAPRVYRWWYDRIAQGYVRGLEEAIRRGQIRRLDPEVLAFCLMGIGDFLGMRWVLWERTEPRPAVIEAMMDFMLRGLEPTSQPSRPALAAAPAGGHSS